MKYIREYWREAACVLLVSGLFGAIVWLGDADSSVKRMWAIVCIAADIIVLIVLLRALWRLKWRRAFISAAQGILRAVAKFFMRVMEKVSQIMGLNRKNMLYGKTTVTYYSSVGGREKKAARRTLKWKQLGSERERLGFLYRYMINERMDAGMRARASDTPAELRERLAESREHEELFELYIDARYDERVEVRGEQIDSLKARIAAPDKIK